MLQFKLDSWRHRSALRSSTNLTRLATAPDVLARKLEIARPI